MTTIIAMPTWLMVSIIAAYMILCAWVVSLQVELVLMHRQFDAALRDQIASRRERRERKTP